MTPTSGENIPTKRRRKWRWGRVVLILSLALNLLFIGAVAGSIWAARQGPPWGGGVMERFVLKRLLRDIPEPRQAKIRQIIAEHRQRMRANWREARQRRYRLGQALWAEPFDPERVLKAATALQEAHARNWQELSRMTAAVLAELTPEERRRLLKRRFFRRLFAPPPRGRFPAFE